MNYNQWLDDEYQIWIDGLKELAEAGNLEAASQLPMVMVPERFAQDFGGTGNATQRRYKYYANKIAMRLSRMRRSDILEIGGGYGAFCKAFYSVAGELINSYHILDLPQVMDIQRAYLAGTPRLFFGDPHKIDFLISCYCLGELKTETKARYIHEYVARATHGFVIWNPAFAPDPDGIALIRSYHPGLVVTDEYPKTAPFNLQLSW